MECQNNIDLKNKALFSSTYKKSNLQKKTSTNLSWRNYKNNKIFLERDKLDFYQCNWEI